MTWYDPQEIKDQADGTQTAPEFDPEVIAETPVHEDEEVGTWTTGMMDFKDEFDSVYVAP